MPLEHILKNSSQSGKEPTAGQLDFGEISLNFHEDGPFICCKDTSGAIRRIAGIWVNSAAPTNPTPGVWWLDTSTAPAQAKVYESATAGWLIVGSGGGGGGGGGGGVASIAASAPLTSTGGSSPTLGITNATLTAAGAMSAADKTKLDGLSNYSLPVATSTKVGGVMIGDNLVIAAGRLSAQLPGALIYKGTIDLTAAAPATRVVGDTYVNSKAGTIDPSWTGLSGTAAAGDMVLWGGSTWGRVGATGFGVTSVTGAAPVTIAGTAAAPEVGVSAATAAAAGVVRLADAAAITAGTAGRVVDAAQLKAATPDASATVKGLVQLADAAAVTAGTTGRVVDAAQLKAAQAAQAGSATAPATPTTGQVWINNSVTPAVTNVWNGTAWIPQAGATISSATAPTAPATGQVWVDTSAAPNVTKIWDGTKWVTATPDGAAVAAIANDAKYATKAELATENTWDRTGTSLAPHTAGDVVTVSAGTAALPGLAVVGDSNTGLFAPAADTLAVAANGAKTAEWMHNQANGAGLYSVFNTDGTSIRLGKDTSSAYVDSLAAKPGDFTRIAIRGTLIDFNTGTTGTPAVAVRINEKGQVGIGGALNLGLPQILAVSGGAVFQGNNTIDGGGSIRLINSTADSGGYLYANEGASNGLTLDSADGPLVFHAVDGKEKGRFDAHGSFVLNKAGAATAPSLVLSSGGPGDVSTVDASIHFAASGHEAPGTTKIYSTGAHGSRALCFATGPDAAGKERLRIGADGSVTIQQPTGSAAVAFAPGKIYIAGGSSAWAGGPGTNAVKWNATTGEITWDTSTRLAKSHIEDCPYGVDAVKQLQPRIYTRKETGEKEVGFIADEVQAVIPEIVPVGPKSALTGNAEDTEVIPISVNYDKFVAVLTKALQEAMERIENLEAAVAALTPTP